MTRTRLSDDTLEPRLKFAVAALCVFALLVIGLVDFLIGYRVSLLVFYAVPVGIAAVYVGPIIALLLSVLAVAISRGGDLLAGMPYPGDAVFFCNAAIPFAFFVLLVTALVLLTRIRRGLESTVQQRNRALLQEMQERGRLEHEVINLSEREHRRFGQELHDLVSQQLAGIAIDTHLLAQDLATANKPEAGRARAVAAGVDSALTKARNMARGYFTIGLDAAGMAEALRELASRTQQATGIPCIARCPDNLAIGNEDATVQLFRIAQEAVHNAVQHAGASRILVSFERREDDFQLIIEDNGKGLTPEPRKNTGLGLSIMTYRAGLIGGKLTLERPTDGGTRILCQVPAAKLSPPRAIPAESAPAKA